MSAAKTVFGAEDFGSLAFGQHGTGNGIQAIATYPNGFGVSVVRFYGSYGYPDLYEVAVIKVDGDGFDLTYETPVTDDVIGYCTEERVTEIMREVAGLPHD
jgi:hypothetical protein